MWIVLQQARPRQLVRISSTVIRVPRITDLPSITAGLISIRSVVIAVPRHSDDACPRPAPRKTLRTKTGSNLADNGCLIYEAI
jgi:hypothetical protein